MKILINTASTFEGGAIQVALSFIDECRHIRGNEYNVILGVKLRPFVDQKSFPSNFCFYEIDYRPATRKFRLGANSRFFRRIENAASPDVVFTTSGPAYWKPKAPHLCGFNIPQNVYPESIYFRIIPLKKRIKWGIDKVIRRYYFKREAKHFAVQTDDVNSRLRMWFRTENVITVSNTCSAYYLKPRSFPEKLPAKKESTFRFLTFSTFRLHKNLGILKKVLTVLPNDILKNIQFAVTIPKHDYHDFFSEKEKQHILNAGPIRAEEGPSLYMECDAMLLPTLLECFSASYPEAMAMNKPIITSKLSFAHSICQNAALYFDPMDAEDLAEAIKKIVSSRDLRNVLVEKGKERLKQYGTAADRAKAYIRELERISQRTGT